MYQHVILLGIGYETWLISRNEDASKKFVATEILIFDFKLSIGDRCDLVRNIGGLPTESDEQGIGSVEVCRAKFKLDFGPKDSTILQFAF